MVQAKKTTKTVAKKKPATKKPVAKKASVKKAPVKKAAVKKAAPKKVVKAAVKSPAKKATVKAVAPKKNGIPEQMLDAVLKVLDERQAEDVITVDLTGRSSMADYLIIASGRASRQLGAIVQYVREALEKLGVKQIRAEGLTEGNWILIDAGDIILHLFRPEVRSYYDLERIWNRDPNQPA